MDRYLMGGHGCDIHCVRGHSILSLTLTCKISHVLTGRYLCYAPYIKKSAESLQANRY